MQGKHYEDKGDLNLVLIGNRLLVSCSSAPHVWVTNVTPIQDATAAEKSELAEAMQDQSFQIADLDMDALMGLLQT